MQRTADRAKRMDDRQDTRTCRQGVHGSGLQLREGRRRGSTTAGHDSGREQLRQDAADRAVHAVEMRCRAVEARDSVRRVELISSGDESSGVWAPMVCRAEQVRGRETAVSRGGQPCCSSTGSTEPTEPTYVRIRRRWRDERFRPEKTAVLPAADTASWDATSTASRDATSSVRELRRRSSTAARRQG